MWFCSSCTTHFGQCYHLIPLKNTKQPLYLLKTSENQRLLCYHPVFSEGCKIRALATNGLIFIHRIVVRVSITEIKLIGYVVDLFVSPFLVYLAFFLI